MMRTETIDGHTFVPKIVVDGRGWVIDAGCRGWQFIYGINEYVIGQKIYAIDIENFSDNDVPGDTIFKHAALMAHPGEVEAHFFGNGTGNFVKGVNEQPYNGPDRPCETKKVQAITLQDIYEEIGTDIDLLKLDIEGSEYEILANLEPIPKQVSVEFHQHCHEKKHNEWIDRVLQNMSKHYQLIQSPCTDWPMYKYMDCLFIRKDLL